MLGIVCCRIMYIKNITYKLKLWLESIVLCMYTNRIINSVAVTDLSTESTTIPKKEN